MNDKIKFKELMTMVCEIHSKELTSTLADIYWEILTPFTDEQCEKAFKEIILTSKFFPKPADFLEILRGKKTDQSTIAWLEVLDTVKRVGHWQSVKFSNPVIHSVINAMGGWAQLCMMEIKDEKWKQKEFERLFEVISSREGKHPDYLPGENENSNTPYMIAMYEERTGKKFQQEIIEIGFEDKKQIGFGG